MSKCLKSPSTWSHAVCRHPVTDMLVVLHKDFLGDSIREKCRPNIWPLLLLHHEQAYPVKLGRLARMPGIKCRVGYLHCSAA